MKLDLQFEQNQQNINVPFSESGGQLNADFGETSVLHDGQNGATFIPSVSADGIISWTNDKYLPNPEPVNIKGAKGDKGDKGDRGTQGVQGIQGERGEQGQKGDKGDRGEQGIQGVQGAKGETGAQGQKGADGMPATHHWSGTTLHITSASGTSSANLKGDKGDKGETGPQGPTGETGPVGPQGPKGDPGKVGISPTVSVEDIAGGHRVTITDKDGPKTFEVMDGKDGAGGSSGDQPDWNAAEGEPGYVLNRPFYSEVAVGTVLAETSPAFDEEQGVFILTDHIRVTTGEEYTVKWNGTEYTCVCGDVELDSTMCQYLGNTSVMEGDDTGEPFLVLVLPSEVAAAVGCTAQIVPLDGSTELTISITGMTEIVHQIPVKYIPNAAVCIDVETERTGVNLRSYDTTDIVDAILNDGAIYVNLNAKSNTDHWSTERLVGVPFFANATTNLNEYQTMKDYILLLLSAGADPAKIPIKLKVHSLVVDEIYTINITNL